MKTLRLFLILATILSTTPALAEDLLMARSKQEFPEAMLALQESITNQGYTISRVQRVDIGLTAMGYKTDKYRVVFFGKPDEVRELVETHPELVPYLPQKISIFAEADDTLLVAINPQQFKQFFDDPELAQVFERWEADLRAILAAVH
jgi:uncharacterized protein (DUF302 family)